jgi:hypothetical protein
MAGKRALPDIACAACGKAFRPARATARFCSRPCARTINGGQNRKAESWWVNGRGYEEGRVWLDGVQVRVKRHRHVMERHIGRALHAEEDVHHKDGNKLNNDLSNLELVNHADHTRITNAERTYRRGYTLKLSDAERSARAERMSALHRAGRVRPPPARAALAKAGA